MTQQQPIDPERLAALIDGRLTDAEAAAVRAQLADADDDTLSVFADAIAISTEISPGTVLRVESGAAPLPRRPRRWIVPSIALAAAAALLVILVRPDKSPPAFAPYTLAAAIPASAQLPTSSIWSATRGANDGLTAEARAVRVGALMTDLEVGAQRGDSSRTIAAAIVALLEGTSGGATSAAPLLESNGATPLTPERRHEVGREVMLIADSTFASAGAYLEAARLAAAANQSSFFDQFPVTTIASLESDPRVDEPTRVLLRQLNNLANAKPRENDAMRRAVEELLRMLAQ